MDAANFHLQSQSATFSSTEKERDVQKNFSGFCVAGRAVSRSMFDFGKRICDRNGVIVYESRCRSCRKCKLAIKQYKFIDSFSRARFKNELRSFEILRQTPHENFIGFLGSFSDETDGYIVLELGGETLSEYLKREKDRFTIAQVNNVAYQMFLMAAHMCKIGFIPADYSISNILIGCDSCLKAIDFEGYTQRDSSSFSSKYKDTLTYIGGIFLLLQLNLKCIAEHSDYNGSRSYFYDRYVPRSYNEFTPELTEAFIEDSKLWHDHVSMAQRRFISQCFVSEQGFSQDNDRELEEGLAVFWPREPVA